MSSLIEGYNYDIFISYRQKDNKHDGWVTKFVDNLKGELETTFKEDVSLYFDENPHERLEETHNVEKSLEEKLKCLIFIPILSQTYCDPHSYAWKNEFLSFLRLTETDRFGKDIKLKSGNVASRILPIRIHELEPGDVKLYEKETGSVMRSLDFIFKTATGVVRPLQPNEDHPNDNLNKTFYRDQICKTARSIKDMILGMKAEPDQPVIVADQPRESEKRKPETILTKVRTSKERKNKVLYAITAITVLVIACFIYWGLINAKWKKTASSDDKITLTVLPFENLSNNEVLDSWELEMQNLLISSLSNYLSVYPFQTMMEVFDSKGFINSNSLSPIAGKNIARKLKSLFYVSGNINQAGDTIRVSAQLQKTSSGIIERVFEAESETENDLFKISEIIAKSIKDYLEVKKLSTKEFADITPFATSSSPKAFEYFINGNRFGRTLNFNKAIEYWEKSIAIDSSFMKAYYNIALCLWGSGKVQEANNYLSKAFSNNSQMSLYDSLSLEQVRKLIEKDLKQVLIIEKQLVALEPNDGWWKCSVANEYLNFLQYENSANAFEKANGFYKNIGLPLPVAAYYVNYGIALHKIGNHGKENRIYREALKAYPGYSGFTNRQVICALSRNKSKDAQRYLETLKKIRVEQNSSDEDILREQATIYEQAGDLEKAKEIFEKVYSENPGSISIIAHYTNFLIKNNIDLEKGTSLADEALRTAPDNVDLLYSKGMGLLKLGNISEAYSHLKKSWDLRRMYSHEHYLLLKDAEDRLATTK